MTIRTALRRLPALVLPIALAAGVAALAGCGGGGGGDDDATALLERAFDQPVESADVELEAKLELDGLDGFEEPVRIVARGPYVRSQRRLPQLDVDVEIRAQGAGQAIQTGLLSTGDRVFLEFGGAYFEQPRRQVARANRRLAQGGGGGGALSDLGLDADRWVDDAEIEGEQEVGGVTTEHVAGTLDLRALLEDLNGLLRTSADALGDTAQAPRPLGRRDIDRLVDNVDAPTFDVYVGKDDDVVRRVSLSVDLEVPPDDRGDVGGVTGAAIQLSAQLSDVGGEQRIRAPRTASPISALTAQLGGLSGLAGGAALAPPPTDGGAPSEPPAGGDGGAVGDAFERYGDCLDRAPPDDSDAIARCARLLN